MRLAIPEDFEPWIGRKVRVNTAPEPVEILLSDVRRLKVIAEADFREPFVLTFESHWNILLTDDSYECDCGRGGPYRIHLSQLLPNGRTRRYQAVFA